MDDQFEAMKEVDLASALRQMLVDIKNQNCHYWLYTNYFDIQQPTERQITRWYMTPLFLDYDALWNPAFESDAILFDVILKNKLPAEKERILIEYSQICLIRRFYMGDSVKSAGEDTVYYNSQKPHLPLFNSLPTND